MKKVLHKLIPKINLRLLPLKIHYLLFFAALSCVLPFRTVFAKQLGVSATATGIIFTITPFIRLITNLLFGYILDYFKKFRLVLAILLFFVAVTHLGMVFIPPRTPNETQNEYSIQENIDNRNQHIQDMSTVKIKVEISGKCQNYECFQDGKSLCIIQCYYGENVKTFQYFTLSKCPQNCKTLSSQIFSSQNDSEARIIDSKDNFRDVNFDLHKTRNSSLISKSFGRNFDLEYLNDSVKYDMFDRPKFLIWSKEKNTPVYCLKNFTVCNFTMLCFNGTCTFSVDKNQTETNHLIDTLQFVSLQFWTFLVLMCLSSASFSALIIIVESACFEVLQDKPEKFGEQRLWGAIGWGLGAPFGGWINEVVEANSGTQDYSPSFYILAALCIIDIIPVLFIKVKDVPYSKNIFKDVGRLLKHLDILINVIAALFVGILSGFVWNYQFLFLEEIGADQIILGLSQTMECITELMCFVISGWVIKKIGYVNCNSLTFLFFGIRYICLYHIKDPWLSLPVGLLHGPTFGIYYASLTTFGKNNAPPGTEATVQAVLSTAFEGLGAGTGSMIGGVGMDVLGSRATFLCACLLSFSLLCLNVVIQLFLRWKNTKSYKPSK